MSSSAVARRATNAERRFYQWMIVALIAAVVLGFSRSFFLRPFFSDVRAPHEIFFYVHGAIFTIWLALLFIQVSLISAGNVAQHRRIGIAGFVLVPLMVVFGLVGGAIAAHRPGGFIGVPVPPLEFLIIPYAAMLLFALFAGSALALRGNPQAHKRLMLLSTIAIVEAGIARWPFEPYISSPPLAAWTAAAFVLPMIGWDIYSRRTLHPVTEIGTVVMIGIGPVREMISHTGSWLAFAKWASDLVA